MSVCSRIGRYLWAGPASLVGLTAIVLGFWRVRCRVVEGVVEAHGPLIAWGLRNLAVHGGGVAAITLGHVVLGLDALTLDWSRAHERVHVRQYERWGLLFLPAYLIASALAVSRGGHFYFDNAFEAEAWSAAPVNPHPAKSVGAGRE